MSDEILFSEEATNDNIVLKIQKCKKVSIHCYELQFVSGPSFFISDKYFTSNDEQKVFEGAEFSGADLEKLMQNSFCYLCECDAIKFLERAEQCRFNLQLKLKKKGHSTQNIKIVLDALEKDQLLSDLRFAQAWLRARMIGHCESRSKLSNELMARGISRSVISEALNDFFENISEEEILERALAKCQRLGYDEDKTVKKLLSNGFSLKMIHEFQKNYKDTELI